MSDVITKPGLYRQQNGKQADVKWVGDGKALGFDHNGEETCWNAASGKWNGNAPVNFQFHITGQWIPDPPEPPDGFQVMPKEYVAKEGDQVWSTSHGFWTKCFHAIGMTAGQYDQWNDQCRSEAPHFFASPIRKPFSISEHGPGVYETRDGREAVVIGRGCGISFPWTGYIDEGERFNKSWKDCGTWQQGEQPQDLVRYLRPLPKTAVDSPPAQSEWVPTNELRLWKCGYRDIGRFFTAISENESGYAHFVRKWTNGTDSEWRPVKVDG